MLESFLSYIVDVISIKKQDSVLLAVSGGVDSMVMLDLFVKSKYEISVAHVNHSTRNGGSDADAAFVEEYCREQNIPFYLKTLDYIELAKGNFQQNARRARYSFFDSVMNKENVDHLATAHHLEDRWETFLMNLNRSSGINGLTSLRPRTCNLIRPLLSFTKEEIIEYAKVNNISFQKDISNEGDDYLRNRIRHHVTPVAREILPDFLQNIGKTINHLEKEDSLLKELIQSLNLIEVDQKSRVDKIDLQKVATFGNAKTLLLKLLLPYGFTHSDVRDMLESKESGKLFHTASHEALFNRGMLYVRTKKERLVVNIEVNDLGAYQLQDGRMLSYRVVDSTDINNKHLHLDPSKIKGDLLIRSIQPGDSFRPAGMGGKSKKVKDYLVDFKMDRFSKESQLVVEMGGVIVQLVRLRSAEGYVACRKEGGVLIEIVNEPAIVVE